MEPANNDEGDREISDEIKERSSSMNISDENVLKSSDKIVLTNEDLQADEDDENDDVPGDFFDDFLKEDFMAGLDIVDEDEDDEKERQPEESLKKKKKKVSKSEKRKRGEEIADLRKKLNDRARNDETDKDLRYLLNEKEGSRITKSVKSTINADEFDIRRDPIKTRRDIARDKARCEKDKEQKIITEKLKLVETGLVPPGMEMETDLDEIQKQKDQLLLDSKLLSEITSVKPKRSPLKKSESSHKRSASPRKKRSPLRSTRRSPFKNKRRSRQRSPVKSGDRSTRKSIDRSLRKSLDKNRRSKDRSLRKSIDKSIRSLENSLRRSQDRGLRRSQDRSLRRSQDKSDKRSPDRTARRSPDRSARRSPDRSARRSLERSFRRSRDRSPRRSPERIIRRSLERSLRRSLERLNRRRSRSRSPVYRGARHRERHKRSHSRSLSPKRRRDSDKKKSFLQEIAEKLNETRPVPFSHIPNAPTDMYHVAPHQQLLPAGPVPPVPAPVPQPVPPIVPQFQAQYDQNFFIGNQPPMNHPIQNPHNIPHPHLMNTGVFQQNPQITEMQDSAKTKEDVARLFQDKKITLTEFLAITAKPEVYSASPTHMKEKIKVIARCQEAIKYLVNTEKKFTGPLIIQKSEKPKIPVSEKFKSPLLKAAHCKIPFTEIPKGPQQRVEFTAYINDLLQSLGLLEEEVIVINDDTESILAEAQTGVAPPPPQFSKPRLTLKPTENNTLGYHQLSKFCQTDAQKCSDCEKRKKITYKNSSTQCGNDGITFSVGTQVRDDDFVAQLPRNQSLASLTPAQLLARSGAPKSGRMIDVDDFDLLFPAKKPGRPPGYMPYGSEVYGPGRYSPPPPQSGRGPRDTRVDSHRFNYNNLY